MHHFPDLSAAGSHIATDNSANIEKKRYSLIYCFQFMSRDTSIGLFKLYVFLLFIQGEVIVSRNHAGTEKSAKNRPLNSVS